MKNTVALIIMAAYAMIAFVSCGDADPLLRLHNKGNNIPDKPIQHDENLIHDIKDSTKNVIGKTFTPKQLVDIDPGLEGFQGAITMYAFEGRSVEKTRPIIILAQSIFGEDITHSIDEYIMSLDKDTKSKNSFIIVRELQFLPDTTNFALVRADDKTANSTAKPKKITLHGYRDIVKYNKDLFRSTVIQSTSDLGSIYYGGYQNAATLPELELAKSLLILKDEMHFDRKKVAIVAFDPFISMLTILLSQVGYPDKIADIAIVAPVLNTGAGKNYPLQSGATLTKDYLNVGYKVNIVNVNNNYGSVREDLSFDVLRVSDNLQDGPMSFFSSIWLTGGLLNFKEHSKITGTHFYVALGNDQATDTEHNLKGHKLILDDNVTNKDIGLYSLIDNPQQNLKTVVIELSQDDYNFPANTQDAQNLISGSSGLLKYIVEKNN